MTVEINKGKKKTQTSNTSKPAWMKSGGAAQDAIAKEEATAAKKKEDQGKAWRYWMPPGTDKTITFIDGHLDESGVLDVNVHLEHQVQLGGDWKNWLICTSEVEKDEPCPICEDPKNSPSLVASFTVIEHTPYKSPSTGKLYKDQIKLYVPKRGTLNMLQKHAKAHGGLAGCTFEVSRTGDKSAGVGDVYIFTEKRTIPELKAAYPDTDVAVLDYAEEFTYHTVAELREMGFGTKPIGGEAPVDAGGYSNEL